MSLFRKTVRVTFVDDQTDEVLGRSDMPPADLPETFALDTTMHIGDAEWSVVDARPVTRREFSRSKKLTLRLRKIEQIDPGELLFSLPTICDAIPSVGQEAVDGSELVLAEDDWRQVEFVSAELADLVHEQIACVRSIHETEAAEVGWHKLHVRSDPERPITRRFPVIDVARELGDDTAYTDVTWRGCRTRIVDAYAFITPGLTIYGVAPAGAIDVLAIDRTADANPADATIDGLRNLASELNLLLVDWCRCMSVQPHDHEFSNVLTGRR